MDPNEALQALLQVSGPQTTFAPNSRYYGVATASLETPDGRVVVYLRRRLAPPPERLALLQEHSVVQGDRLDNLAAQYFGDPELFWRIADANGALAPDELTETIGRTLRITLPDGLTGSANG